VGKWTARVEHRRPPCRYRRRPIAPRIPHAARSFRQFPLPFKSQRKTKSLISCRPMPLRVSPLGRDNNDDRHHHHHHLDDERRRCTAPLGSSLPQRRGRGCLVTCSGPRNIQRVRLQPGAESRRARRCTSTLGPTQQSAPRVEVGSSRCTTSLWDALGARWRRRKTTVASVASEAYLGLHPPRWTRGDTLRAGQRHIPAPGRPLRGEH
jgi:hypothetical protein